MRLVFLVWLGMALAALPGRCADSAPVDVTAPQTVEQKLAKLRAENEALRAENQMLRRQLVAKNPGAPDTVLPVRMQNRGSSSPEPAPDASDTGYWLSSKSHIRHNASCRNYKKVKGRPCGPRDGKACKACGG